MTATGKARTLFGTALGFSVLLLFFYWDSQASFTLLYALIALLALSFAHTMAAPMLVRVKTTQGEYLLEKGSPFTYTVAAKNMGPLPYLGLSVSLSPVPGCAEESLWLPLPPARGKRGDISLLFPYRGLYTIGPQQAVATDALGLFHRRLRLPDCGPAHITVCPQPLPGFSLPIQRLAGQQPSRRRDQREVRTDVDGLRQYGRGDDFRRIHWKLTAKRQELMVKEYPRVEPSQLQVYLDTRQIPGDGLNSLQVEDKLTSVALSAAIHCRTHGIPARLHWGTADPGGLSLSGSLEPLRRLLAQLPFTGETLGLESLSPLQAEDELTLDIVVVLARLNQQALHSLAALGAGGHQVLVYHVADGQDSQSSYGVLKTLGIRVFPIPLDEEVAS